MSFLPSSRTIPHPVLAPAEVAPPAPAPPTQALSPSAQLDSHLASAISELSSTKAAPMITPAKGSFAAELRAMLDEGLAGVEQAKADGRAQVKEALGKLSEATVATKKVSGSLVKTITDQADTIMSDLGQISNDIGGS